MTCAFSRRWPGILAVLVSLLLCMPPALCASAELRLAQVIELALAQNPEIRVQEAQVEAARGRHRQASGQFDWVLSSSLSYDKVITPTTHQAVVGSIGALHRQTELMEAGSLMGLSRQLRNGSSVEATISMLSRQDSTSRPVGGQQNLATLDVALKVPLLQGRGTNSAAILEEIAKLDVLSNRYTLREWAAQTLHRTLLAYWDFRTRVELEKIALDSEQRSNNLLTSYSKLVDASEKPRADLVLLKADHSDKVVARQAATLARAQARKDLGRLLGLDPHAIDNLPDPAESLPAVVTIPALTGARLSAVGTAALAQRPDLRALQLQLEAAERHLKAASQALQPRLDLQLGVGLSKASEGGSRYRFVTQSGNLQSDPSLFAKLNFQFPLQNNTASGVVQERAALVSQLALRRRDLANSIVSGVEIAWQNLNSSATQLAVAREGLGLYELAVNQEMVKQRNGISTLIDVINVESRFVNARINVLLFHLAYARAVASLRLETGTLLPTMTLADAETDRFSLDMHDISGLGPLANPH